MHVYSCCSQMLCMVFCVAEDFLPFTSYFFHLVLVELLKEWGLKGKTSKHYESSIFVGRFNWIMLVSVACNTFFFSLIYFRISCLPNTMIQICALTFAAVNLFTITHLRHMSRLTWCLKTLVGTSLLEDISLAQLQIALNLCKYFYILLFFQKSVKHC